MKTQNNLIDLSSRIDNHLLLNSSFINNLGLIHGKMGLSIFFFQIGRVLKNRIYYDYAGELIDEIYQELNDTTSTNFENGLAGIGWGLNFLIRNGFVDVDADDILKEIDSRVSKEIKYNTPVEIGLLNGLIGLGVYLLIRTKHKPIGNGKKYKFDREQSLIYLIGELDKATEEIDKIIIEPKFSPQQGILTEKKSNTWINKSYNSPNNDPRKDTHISYRPIEPVSFDITWDYPILILFLADTFKQDIHNSITKEIIIKCAKSLEKQGTLPKCVGNRLMLAFSIINLLFTIENSPFKKSPSEIDFIQKIYNLNEVVEKLLKGISRESILLELSSITPTIRHGIPGIIWIYKQLYNLTKDSSYSIEAKYLSASKTFLESFENWYDSNLGNHDNKKILGLLCGLSGARLVVS